jgi:preprotein translocase subunit YajC
MEIILTQDDIQKLDNLIQVTPFKYAMPFFQFLLAKAQEAREKEAQNIQDESNKDTRRRRNKLPSE